MKMNATPKSDQFLEALFSLLRWFFLFACIWMYLAYYETVETLPYFWALAGFGLAYMATAQLVLWRSPLHSRTYYVITRLGIVFDLVAVLSIMSLTGWAGSPLFPISYLIVLHASVYWGVRGGLYLAVLLAAGYTGILAISGALLPVHPLPYHVMNYIYLLFVGGLGGVIVARERKHLSEKSFYEQLAKKDYLTGLYNHRCFQESLSDSLHKSKRLVVVMADIDYFKSVNDRYGHQTGDLVLKEVAATLDTHFCPPIGSAYRYGGEEFALLVYDQDTAKVAARLEELRERIAQLRFDADGQPFSVTMSFGVCPYRGQSKEELLHQADEALYEAKHLGRNRVQLA
ncbi:GGDEF domain-containing protein [Paenibacillus sp. YYML68]|uniref:GGDEF domain-containing protein n=1 Tax=Paenibacillus sp. YYML68 TaxID=2909250 RepID=UPI002491DDE7|nr:GGDEF domain-containing protein [Paenibacillus sp. YYML68]